MVSDQDPVVVPKLAAVQLTVPVVVQTRPQVGCGPDLPLPVDEGQESLDDVGLDLIFSGQESTVKISDVSHDICVEPDAVPAMLTGRLRCRWPYLWSFRRHRRWAVTQTCPCPYIRGRSH